MTYEKFQVTSSIEAPASFLRYLRDNVTRFYKKDGPTIQVQGPSDKIDLRRAGEALRQESHRELMEIRAFLDHEIQSGQPFEFLHMEVSMT